jgi:hypothetical protein
MLNKYYDPSHNDVGQKKSPSAFYRLWGKLQNQCKEKGVTY